MAKTKTKQISVRLPLDVEKKLREMAIEDNRSLSNMITLILRRVVSKERSAA